MDYQEYIKPELLILIPVCYILAEFIKGAGAVKKKWIPMILGGFGILLSGIYIIASEGFSLMSIFTSITQGILIAGAAVYVNQLIKQGGKKE